MSEFPQFAAGVFKGLGEAATTDIDVFLLTCSGVLLGSRQRRLQAMGGALGVYVTYRRMDGYVGALSSKLHLIAAVMKEGQTVAPSSPWAPENPGLSD